jgi:hypothetical protein
MTHLQLTRGMLDRIDKNAFAGLSSLTTLYLSDNKLKCVSRDWFNPTPAIGYIDLRGNLISSLHVDAFKNLPNAFYIILWQNLITYIPNLNLNNTGTAATKFDIGFETNPIFAIHPSFVCNLFQSRSKPTKIQFFKNGASSLPRTSCVPIITYDYISEIRNDNWVNSNAKLSSCYGNWTSTLENQQVQCDTGVEIACRYFLDQFNRYTCVLNGVSGSLTSIAGTHIAPFSDLDVTRVYLTNSQLTEIPSVVQQKFPNTNYLYAGNSSIGNINDLTFNCGNLVELDLSFNKINTITDTSFRVCTKLKTIELTGNDILRYSSISFTLRVCMNQLFLHRL